VTLKFIFINFINLAGMHFSKEFGIEVGLEVGSIDLRQMEEANSLRYRCQIDFQTFLRFA